MEEEGFNELTRKKKEKKKAIRVQGLLAFPLSPYPFLDILVRFAINQIKNVSSFSGDHRSQVSLVLASFITLSKRDRPSTIFLAIYFFPFLSLSPLLFLLPFSSLTRLHLFYKPPMPLLTLSLSSLWLLIVSTFLPLQTQTHTHRKRETGFHARLFLSFPLPFSSSLSHPSLMLIVNSLCPLKSQVKRFPPLFT